MARTIKLRSGTWTWSVEEDEEQARRAGGRLSRTLVLRDTANPANRMVLLVPPHLGGPGDGAVVAAAAVHPNRRFVQDPEGLVWTVWPVADDPEVGPAMARQVTTSRELRASKEGGGSRATLLPVGRGLGQLTGEELLDLLD